MMPRLSVLRRVERAKELRRSTTRAAWAQPRLVPKTRLDLTAHAFRAARLKNRHHLARSRSRRSDAAASITRLVGRWSLAHCGPGPETGCCLISERSAPTRSFDAAKRSLPLARRLLPCLCAPHAMVRRLVMMPTAPQPQPPLQPVQHWAAALRPLPVEPLGDWWTCCMAGWIEAGLGWSEGSTAACGDYMRAHGVAAFSEAYSICLQLRRQDGATLEFGLRAGRVFVSREHGSTARREPAFGCADRSTELTQSYDRPGHASAATCRNQLVVEAATIRVRAASARSRWCAAQPP